MMKRSLLAASLSVASVAAQAAAQTPSLEEMWGLIQAQQAEIESLKAQLGQTESKLVQTEVKVAATADAIEQGTVTVGASPRPGTWVDRTSLGGYGEHHFNHVEDADDQVDAHRFVLFVGHQFTESVRFFSEFELEHGLAGEGEPGEVELEQAFIEYDYADNHSVQVGQFLLPVGILNETHEPETFYGTERNKVESEVIPSTWWEAGIMFKGEIAPGLTYNAAVHSGLKADSTRIRGGRQKNAEAKAEDLAFTGRLKYTGLPGLELAASVQLQQDISQGESSSDAEATLLEAHAIYRKDRLALRALWAEWDIDGQEFEMANADVLSGWYVEPSYRLTDKLGIFLRYSEWDRGDRMSNDYETYDFGINYWLTPQVVFKADYTDTVGEADEGDAFNLGLGWSF